MISQPVPDTRAQQTPSAAGITARDASQRVHADVPAPPI